MCARLEGDAVFITGLSRMFPDHSAEALPRSRRTFVVDRGSTLERE
jgi:hypothetical protein